jgi:hypothetical protein
MPESLLQVYGNESYIVNEALNKNAPRFKSDISRHSFGTLSRISRHVDTHFLLSTKKCQRAYVNSIEMKVILLMKPWV